MPTTTYNDLLTLFTPSTMPATASLAATSWANILNGVAGDGITNVKNFGAVGDGVTDDTAAIQSCLNLAIGATSPQRVLMPNGVYKISSPLQLYSQTILEGPEAVIGCTGGFSGSECIKLGLPGSDTFCSNSAVLGVTFDSSVPTATWAIKAISGFVTNCIFQNITLVCNYGLGLDIYTQSCLVDNLLSTGAVDRIVWLAGNNNLLNRVDKEDATGTTTDPYVKIFLSPTQTANTGNMVRNLLIEGTGSAGKTGALFSQCDQIKIDGVWCELSTCNGFGLTFSSCTGIEIIGTTQSFNPTQGISFVGSTGFIDFIDNEGYFQISQIMSIDSASWIEFRALKNKQTTNTFPLSAINQRIRNQLDNQILTGFPTYGYSPLIEQHDHGNNLLLNPSFEGGMYGWTYSGSDAITFPASAVAPGNMINIASITTSQNLYQTVPVLANVPYTFTALVQASGAATTTIQAGIYAYNPTIGITALGSSNTFTGSGWQKLVSTFMPTSSGNVLVGIMTFNSGTAMTLNVDECNLSIGTVGMINPSRFQHIDLGPIPITFGSTFPSTGTWPRGAICFNTTPSSGGPPGWVCTTGGTSGTWKDMANLA